MHKLIFLCLLCLIFVSCSKPASTSGQAAAAKDNVTQSQSTENQKPKTDAPIVLSSSEQHFLNNISEASAKANLPLEQAKVIMSAVKENPGFILDLLAVLSIDDYLRKLVDKQTPLPREYEPTDLVELSSGKLYQINRQGLFLRKAASDSLEEMSAAARAAGISLLVSSCYRSYAYQEEVYSRNVRQMGREEADRESARPGHSQHQLGLAVDFGSIDDSFAETAAGRWLFVNASRFGWSLSYPRDYEEITGYRWESWHYRYVGQDLAQFINDYFGGTQQYALKFLNAWEEISQ